MDVRTPLPITKAINAHIRELPWSNSTWDVLLIAAAAVGIVFGTMLAAAAQAASRPLDTWADLLIVCAAAAHIWRRAAPLATLAGTVAAAGVYLLAGYPYGPIQLCMVFAMVNVAQQLPLSTSFRACSLAATTAIAVVLPRLLHGVTHQPLILIAGWAGWLVVPWALGALVKVRADAAVRLRRELIARVALEERMWLTREVHDVAGHGLSAIAMQAGVALVVLDERPDQARASLEAIRATSTRALDELRAVLDVLHTTGGIASLPSWHSADILSPTADPRLHDLYALIDRVEAAGLSVELNLANADGTLPQGVAAVAYRVVQEALTNVLRHAGPTRAVVRIVRETTAVIVEVADNGQGAAGRQWTIGRGLAGMRSRVEALGGSLVVGPRARGGFAVLTRLPLTAEEP